MCLGRPTCEQLVVRLKLTIRKLAQWKEGCFQNLKEGWKAARGGLASGLVRLALLAGGESYRVESAMGKDQVTVVEW